MALLDIQNLTVQFETASGWFKAVDGVSLSVEPGEVLADDAGATANVAHGKLLVIFNECG